MITFMDDLINAGDWGSVSLGTYNKRFSREQLAPTIYNIELVQREIRELCNDLNIKEEKINTKRLMIHKDNAYSYKKIIQQYKRNKKKFNSGETEELYHAFTELLKQLNKIQDIVFEREWSETMNFKNVTILHGDGKSDPNEPCISPLLIVR